MSVGIVLVVWKLAREARWKCTCLSINVSFSNEKIPARYSASVDMIAQRRASFGLRMDGGMRHDTGF
jgi:hypothetical protein